MINEGILEKFQIYLEKYLSGLNEFRSVPVLLYKQSDIDSILASEACNGLGVAIVILPPTPVDVITNVPGPVFQKIVCEIQVIENLATNHTGCTAIYIAEKIMQYLHFWRPQVTDWNEKLILSESTPWKVAKNENNNIINMRFETYCSLKG